MTLDIDEFMLMRERKDTLTAIQEILEEYDDQAFSVREVAAFHSDGLPDQISDEVAVTYRGYLETLVRLSEIEEDTNIQLRQEEGGDGTPYYAHVKP